MLGWRIWLASRMPPWIKWLKGPSREVGGGMPCRVMLVAVRVDVGDGVGVELIHFWNACLMLAANDGSLLWSGSLESESL